MRRVAGYHDDRLYGISDLLGLARHASVFDIGCNRGKVGEEFARNGATTVHGCDEYAEGIATARHNFVDKRNCKSRFEIVDLTQGPDAVRAAFGEDYLESYDVVLFLDTYHKLRRTMDRGALNKLIFHFGKRTGQHFAWRGHEEEIDDLDELLGSVGLKRVHTSFISTQLTPAAIWARRG